ncbi:MAG: dTDP-glucose 4,6-dehydratase [Fimbriimonadaceae bacterium]|nr:dTDP-glucose 4,6-dehydratase [Fimbriimonadaceae bacterium]QYK55659.1 MAG: dTDP-glucose 4,6-dehydratase [Fimbriimonadaceae bacterium]
MKILVTGAAGFIGSHFVRHALREGPDAEIVVLDALRYSGNLSTMQDFWERVRFYPGVVQDAHMVSHILTVEKITHMVNFAAESHNDRSLQDNGNFVMTNTFGVQVLLDACRKHGLERFVQVSTDEVYGSTLSGEFSELSPLQPNTPYAASKAGGDLLCRAHFTAFKTPVVVTRGGNTYGPYQYPEKLVPFFLTRLIEGKKVPLYGEGSQVREWIHVQDHAAGVWAALLRGEPGEVYNIGDTNQRTNRQTVDGLLALTHRDSSFVKQIPDPRKGAHDARYSMDSSKARGALGWAPRVEFEKGMAETAEWYAANEWWWRPIVSDQGYGAFVSSFYGPSLGDDL